jgi:hypothetical protein
MASSAPSTAREHPADGWRRRRGKVLTPSEGLNVGTWSEIARVAEDRHHVMNVRLAEDLGIDASTFFRRTASEAWVVPFPGVRIAPGKGEDLRPVLVAAIDAADGIAAAAGRTAAWLHGFEQRPPKRLEIVVRHGAAPPEHDLLLVRRSRWLRASDVAEVDAVPTLTGPALALSAASWRADDLRALLIDAAHHGVLDLGDVEQRAKEVGPIAGKGRLRRLAAELAGKRMESIFEDDVRRDLDRRGYRPLPGPEAIETPDGRGLTIDIALPWCVAVEPEGDAHHRTREQRRADRRRTAQYAGTPWVPVPVDWRDRQLEPERVLSSIDDAVLAQHRAGHGAEVPLPSHLATRATT